MHTESCIKIPLVCILEFTNPLKVYMASTFYQNQSIYYKQYTKQINNTFWHRSPEIFNQMINH